MARVLIVDDDTFIAKIMEDLLQYHKAKLHTSDYKMHITTAKSAIEALDLLSINNYELIITDVMMAKMDGFEFIREVRKKYSQSDLPIIVMSVIDWDELSYNSIRAGATDWFTKTFTGENLEKFLKVVFNLITER